MRILVTGATGVVGRRLVPLLVAGGHDVTAIARSDDRARRLEEQGATPTVLDLFDGDRVKGVARGHEVVVNLATHVPPASKVFLPGAWRENSRIRRAVSRNLVDAAVAAGAGRFIQESFAGIYADGGDEWIHEGDPVRPARYVRSIVDAEEQATRFGRRGVGVILRFALFYGPDSSHTTDTIRFVLNGTAPAFGSPEGFISSVSTDDAAAAVTAALNVPSGIYNVSDNRPVRRREYFDSLAEALGVGTPWIPPAWVAKLAGSVGETMARSHRLSNEKLKRASGWSPRLEDVTEGWRVVVERLGARRMRGAG